MQIHRLHDWPTTWEVAIALQRQLASRIDTTTPLKKCDLIAGADISYNRFSPTLYAAVVVLSTKDWSIVETAGVIAEATFPYRTGLLTFREAPAVLDVFAKLESEPDVIMIDGQGYAHPRRIGIASHLGLWLYRPPICLAKNRLIGRFLETGGDA